MLCRETQVIFFSILSLYPVQPQTSGRNQDERIILTQMLEVDLCLSTCGEMILQCEYVWWGHLFLSDGERESAHSREELGIILLMISPWNCTPLLRSSSRSCPFTPSTCASVTVEIVEPWNAHLNSWPLVWSQPHRYFLVNDYSFTYVTLQAQALSFNVVAKVFQIHVIILQQQISL